MSKYKVISNVFKKQYENFIGGKWVEPTDKKYIDNKTSINGEFLCKIRYSSDVDIEKALDAVHAAKDKWVAFKHYRKI